MVRPSAWAELRVAICAVVRAPILAAVRPTIWAEVERRKGLCGQKQPAIWKKERRRRRGKRIDVVRAEALDSRRAEGGELTGAQDINLVRGQGGNLSRGQNRDCAAVSVAIWSVVKEARLAEDRAVI